MTPISHYTRPPVVQQALQLLAELPVKIGLVGGINGRSLKHVRVASVFVVSVDIVTRMPIAKRNRDGRDGALCH